MRTQNQEIQTVCLKFSIIYLFIFSFYFFCLKLIISGLKVSFPFFSSIFASFEIWNTQIKQRIMCNIWISKQTSYIHMMDGCVCVWRTLYNMSNHCLYMSKYDQKYLVIFSLYYHFLLAMDAGHDDKFIWQCDKRLHQQRI